jgi:hypothetical protein
MTSLSLHNLTHTPHTTRRLDHVGSFYSRSNEIVFSDIASTISLLNARSGSWHVYVERVFAESYAPIISLVLLNHRIVGDPIAVNSVTIPWTDSGLVKEVTIGSIAVFDETCFVHADADERERKAFEDGWMYALDQKGERNRVKVVKGGVFCKTGIGDGRYRVDVGVGVGGMAWAIQIDFTSYTGDYFAERFAKGAADRRDAVPPDVATLSLP